MKVPITGNADLDALTVRTALKLHATGRKAQRAARAMTVAARRRRQQVSQRYRRARRRVADRRRALVGWLDAAKVSLHQRAHGMDGREPDPHGVRSPFAERASADWPAVSSQPAGQFDGASCVVDGSDQ